jgi:hypothetical protein
MTAPLAFLGPAIELIGTNASVLPATGGAFEDMARPDVEEADDRFFGARQDAQEGFQDFSESPTPDWRSLYRPTPSVFPGRACHQIKLLYRNCPVGLHPLAQAQT